MVNMVYYILVAVNVRYFMKNTMQPTARLMILTFREFERDLLRALEKQGVADVTLADFNVLRHLDPQGLQLTTLAEHAGLSKQGVGQMVKDLEKKGYVKVKADQCDGRAKVVMYTAKGKKLIHKAIVIVGDIEKHYEILLGSHNYENLRESLLILLEKGCKP
mgnify:CR=1 FL=1